MEAQQHLPAIAVLVAEPVTPALLRFDFRVATLDGAVGEPLGQLPPRQQIAADALGRTGATTLRVIAAILMFQRQQLSV